jgi:hypothetical protein
LDEDQKELLAEAEYIDRRKKEMGKIWSPWRKSDGLDVLWTLLTPFLNST